MSLPDTNLWPDPPPRSESDEPESDEPSETDLLVSWLRKRSPKLLYTITALKLLGARDAPWAAPLRDQLVAEMDQLIMAESEQHQLADQVAKQSTDAQASAVQVGSFQDLMESLAPKLASKADWQANRAMKRALEVVAGELGVESPPVTPPERRIRRTKRPRSADSSRPAHATIKTGGRTDGRERHAQGAAKVESEYDRRLGLGLESDGRWLDGFRKELNDGTRND